VNVWPGVTFDSTETLVSDRSASGAPTVGGGAGALLLLVVFGSGVKLVTDATLPRSLPLPV
jgi:hypothetical protein